jgi:hypothetical protein
VLLLHVSQTPPPLELLAELHGLGEPIRRRGVRVKLRTTRGPPAERIIEIAEQRQVSWILMGTSGHAFRDGRGSVARRVMETSRVPVITLRPGVAPAPTTHRIAVVSAGPDTPSARVGRALAQESAARVVEYRARRQGDAPTALEPIEASNADFDVAVVPLEDGCAIGTWCERLLRDEPRPVVLVSGRAGSLRAAAAR